ncbi:hypothetical protein HO173_003657 [Letharia columbiana]|uniref:Uncharacterized protein n=1 Tax=Letharia columbiana TaxID=112416 RepID=A0A8H6G106_9LECA|nr:uncharacterized protein HO173_003657 [Letharia columbiana]KAF6238377.1 hypothetical protein HO173_003657 [Letharia columbiana]
MPVTIVPASHNDSNTQVTRSPQYKGRLLEIDLTKESCENMLQSTFDELKDPLSLASANGFVHSALKAHSEHYHLVISPVNVWFAILSQLNIWINANGAEARGKFFVDVGKKGLTVTIQDTGDEGKNGENVVREIEKNMPDPGLREWILPAFTGNSAFNAVVASVLMMGDMQKYFSYPARSECGVPSVVLLGEQSDWVELYKKLDKLETFGVEPAQFRCLLVPVIARFIKSFDDPTSKDVVDFWGHMVSAESRIVDGGVSVEYEGWISAFCFWSEQGENINDRHIQFRGGRGFTLDGVIYHAIDCGQIPPVYASFPVKINDDRNEINSLMVVWSVATPCIISDGTKVESDVNSKCVGIASVWGLFNKRSRVKETAEASEAVRENLAQETEPKKSEDGLSTTTTCVNKPGLISRLINLFLRTGISKQREHSMAKGE